MPKTKDPNQVFASALEKHNYINLAFETNANNSLKRIYPKQLILFFTNSSNFCTFYLETFSFFRTTLSCFHPWNVIEMKKTTIYKLLLSTN